MERETEVARIPVRATRALIADALIAAGLPQPDAARCAELMSEADLTGADGHGIFRLPSRYRAARRRPRWSTATTAWAIW
jgi:L-2-hydroxycarboxylate dehydrogenase (NAD+)